MKLYVAGPMTNLPEFNFPAFAEASTRLRGAGYDVVSPHEVALPCGCSGLPPQCGAPDHSWAEFLRSDLLALLAHAEGIALLPGWENSRGATLEKHVAERLGLDVRLMEDWLETARREKAVSA